MANTKKNREWRRSKRLLTEAYIELLKENPRKKIRINQLCKRADVSRPTFYAHFDSLDCIATDIFRNWLDEILILLKKRFDFDETFSNFPKDQNLLIYQELGKTAWFYELLIEAKMTAIVFNLLKDFSQELTTLISTPFDSLEDSEVKQIIRSISINSNFYLYDYWIRSGMKKTAKEIAAISDVFMPFREFDEFKYSSFKSEN